MKYKILVTPRSFGKNEPRPVEMLSERGYEVIMNPYQRIMTQEEMIKEIMDVDGIVIGVDLLNSADACKEPESHIKVQSGFGQY